MSKFVLIVSYIDGPKQFLRSLLVVVTHAISLSLLIYVYVILYECIYYNNIYNVVCMVYIYSIYIFPVYCSDQCSRATMYS